MSSKKKRPRDLNAPKKPTRPFIYSMMDVRMSVKEELGLSTGWGFNIQSEVSKECGRRWAIMTPEEKEKYMRMFREDTKRYEEDAKDYHPSPEFVNKLRLAKLHRQSEFTEKSRIAWFLKASKIKKPTRSFIFFLVEVRKSVQEELGFSSGDGVDIRTEVSRECGRRWAIMTSKEKEKYHNMFKEDTIRYQKDSKNYQLSISNLISNVSPKITSYFDYLASSWAQVATSIPHLEPDQVQEEVWRGWCQREESSDTGQVGDENQNVVKNLKKRIRNKVVKNLVDVDVPDSPKLAFQYFLITMKEELKKCLPDMSFNHILKHVSEKWKVMTDEQKIPFFDLERVEKEKRKKDLVASCKVIKESDLELQFKAYDAKEDFQGSKLEIDLNDISDTEGYDQDLPSTRVSFSICDDTIVSEEETDNSVIKDL